MAHRGQQCPRATLPKQTRNSTMDHFAVYPQIEETQHGLTDEDMAGLFEMTVDQLWSNIGVTCETPATWTWKPSV